MVNRVDPPQSRWPSRVQEQNGAPSREMQEWFHNDKMWKEAVTFRLGGPVDNIDNAINFASNVEDQLNVLKSLLPPQIVNKSVDIAYTAAPNMFLNVSNGAPIVLPAYPQKDCVIIVRNADGKNVTISGNGKTINGETKAILTKRHTTVEFYYFVNSDEWVAR